jgi:hypothetical protein
VTLTADLGHKTLKFHRALSDVSPLLSTDWTSRRCCPLFSPEYDAGLVHVDHGPPSIRHWNVTPESVLSNVNVTGCTRTSTRGPKITGLAGFGLDPCPPLDDAVDEGEDEAVGEALDVGVDVAEDAAVGET